MGSKSWSHEHKLLAAAGRRQVRLALIQAVERPANAARIPNKRTSPLESLNKLRCSQFATCGPRTSFSLFLALSLAISDTLYPLWTASLLCERCMLGVAFPSKLPTDTMLELLYLTDVLRRCTKKTPQVRNPLEDVL